MDTEYADCALCGKTTDPQAEPAGIDEPGDSMVIGEPGNGRSYTESVGRTVPRKAWANGCE